MGIGFIQKRNQQQQQITAWKVKNGNIFEKGPQFSYSWTNLFETKMSYYNESISLFLGKTIFVIITWKFE
jgi:hypothetical protein